MANQPEPIAHIRCGNCFGKHFTVDEVRECYAWTPADEQAIAAAEWARDYPDHDYPYEP